MEIRRGRKKPNNIKLYQHQNINNEILAQLAFASFFKAPFTTKDKKRTLFNNDYSQSEYTINQDYHKIFNYSNEESNMGILFKKTKEDINELLFIAFLYKASKKFLKKIYNFRIQISKGRMENSDDDDILTLFAPNANNLLKSNITKEK